MLEHLLPPRMCVSRKAAGKQSKQVRVGDSNRQLCGAGVAGLENQLSRVTSNHKTLKLAEKNINMILNQGTVM